MYNIGDKVVYPIHGAGIIEAIETKEILGTKREYYILNLPVNNLRIMLPCETAKGAGIREIISPKESKRVMAILAGKEKLDAEINSDKWNKRFRQNMNKIKSGNVYELAAIVHNLNHRDNLKPLSTGEKKILNQAKEILLSELTLVYANHNLPEDITKILTIR